MGSPGAPGSSLEQGDIYFLYRPRVGRDRPGGLEDVQRLLMALKPWDGREVGRKRLPRVEDRERSWGFVAETGGANQVRDLVERRTYRTATRGERLQPEARPAGEGVYAIVRHGDHTHLAYRLESPTRPGRPQAELNIAPEASYIVSVRDPAAPRPPGAPRDGGDAASPDFPAELRERFDGRRFIPVDPPAFLDHEGAEFVLIGAARDAAELGLDLDAKAEESEWDGIYRDLPLHGRGRMREPLHRGRWT
jgi:hypothetical protein